VGGVDAWDFTRRASVTAALAAALGCARTPALVPPPPSSASRLLGAAVPAFHRPTLAGGQFDTIASAGQVLVVDFFAAYCAPCRHRLPLLEALHRKRPELAIVGISLDESAERTAALVARYGLTFPVVHDSGAALAGRFRVAELPAAFVVDRAGRLVWAGGGEQAEDALTRAAEAVLRAPDVAVTEER
jgi:cytochrome c biogenesis protein CcmG/thiol:disulfide interchange protein DsbE